MFNLIEKLYLMQKKNKVYYDSKFCINTRTYYDEVCKKKFLNKSVTIVFVDVDNLKTTNDTLGHHEGTKLLKAVASDLKSISDVYEICRIGGDEFIIIGKPTMDTEQLSTIKNISYGVYIKEPHEEVYEAVMKSDAKMFKMKKNKKEIKNHESSN